MVSGQLQAPPALPPGKEPSLIIGKERRWAPEPVGSTQRGQKFCSYRNSNSNFSAVQPVTSLYTNCETPAPTEWDREIINRLSLFPPYISSLFCHSFCLSSHLFSFFLSFTVLFLHLFILFFLSFLLQYLF
jgi:hypothetical protein